MSDEAETPTVHKGEVPDSSGSPQGPAADDVEEAGAPGVPVRDAQQSDVAPDEPVLIELDLSQIPKHLRVSDVQRVFRAAGMRLRFAIEEEG